MNAQEILQFYKLVGPDVFKVATDYHESIHKKLSYLNVGKQLRKIERFRLRASVYCDPDVTHFRKIIKNLIFFNDHTFRILDITYVVKRVYFGYHCVCTCHKNRLKSVMTLNLVKNQAYDMHIGVINADNLRVILLLQYSYY